MAKPKAEKVKAPVSLSPAYMWFLTSNLESLTCTGVLSYELKTLTNRTYWAGTIELVIKKAMAGEGFVYKKRRVT